MARSISVAVGDRETIRWGCRLRRRLEPLLSWMTTGKPASLDEVEPTGADWQAEPARSASAQSPAMLATSFALAALRCLRIQRTSRGVDPPTPGALAAGDTPYRSAQMGAVALRVGLLTRGSSLLAAFPRQAPQWLPGQPLPAHSCATAPDSHRLPCTREAIRLWVKYRIGQGPCEGLTWRAWRRPSGGMGRRRRPGAGFMAAAGG